jgi:predicted O-methyltransferase YrrM
MHHRVAAAEETAMDELAHLKPPAPLAAIARRTEALAFSMPSEPRTGALLRVLAASKPNGRLLELGTGTGLSTAWLLDGMNEDATLVTVDVDPGPQAVARELLGHDRRLTIVTEDAAAFLRRQQPVSFDLIFADAMPGKFDRLDDALALLRVGGLYVIDDMLPQENWPADHAPRIPALTETLAARPELILVSMAWSSGLTVAVRTR